MMSEEGIFLNKFDSSKSYVEDQMSTSSLTGERQSKKLVLQEGGAGSRKGRAPRRVLHFSDGTLEEYSTDEEEEEQEVEKKKLHESQQQLVDASKMSWGGWLGHHAGNTGNTALAACDYLGENIAYFLGITSPKYHYELEEHQRALKEEEDERREMVESMVGWTSSPEDSVSATTNSTAATPSTAEPSPASLPQTYLLFDDSAAAAAAAAKDAKDETPVADHQQQPSSLPAILPPSAPAAEGAPSVERY